MATKSGVRESRMLIYMSNAQRKGLRDMAAAIGSNQQALIRRGIDLVLAQKPKAKRRGRKS